MISTKEQGDKLSITLKPNNSSTVTNNIVFLVACIVMHHFRNGFFFVGAVMILPFAGLEILALFIVLRINRSWVEQHKLLLLIIICLLSNSYKKSELKKYARFHSKFIVEKDQTKKVFIHKKEKLPIGSFLNEEEIEDLIQCLKSKVNDLNHSVR